MKRFLLVTIISIALFSCSKNSEQITVAKSEVEKKLSEIEKKGIDYNCVEMSDREALNEIAKYYNKKQEKAQTESDQFMQENKLGKYRIIPLEEMETSEMESYLRKMEFGKSLLNEVTRHLKSYTETLNILSKLKGENTFYKVVSVKATPDTLIFNKVYLDNNNKIINTQYLK